MTRGARRERDFWRNEIDRRQLFAENALDFHKQPLPLGQVPSCHLLVHQVIDSRFPFGAWLRLRRIPEMKVARTQPEIHVHAGEDRLSSTESRGTRCRSRRSANV